MCSLFEGWPKDRLAQIFRDTVRPIPPDWGMCERYWSIPRMGIFTDLVNPQSHALLPPGASTGGIGSAGPGSASGGRSRKTLKTRIYDLLRGKKTQAFNRFIRESFFGLPSFSSKPLREWVAEFKPDVIYIMVDALHMMRLANTLAEQEGIPIVPHITDDWLGTPHMVAGVTGRIKNEWARMLKHSPKRIVISPAMGEEYATRYGGSYNSLANPARASAFNPEWPPKTDNVTRLVYAGGLHLNRWKVLGSIAEALEKLKERGLHGTLDIYCPPSDVEAYTDILGKQGAVVKGFVSPDRLPEVLQHSDIVCLVESSDPDQMEYTRLSFSTKVSEYLMAGRCILAVGPPTQASLKYLVQEGVGEVVPDGDAEKLVEKLAYLLQNRDHVVGLGTKARELALQRHEFGSVQEEFYNVVTAAVKDRQ